MADEMHEQIDGLSDEGVAQVIGWRRHLHRNPELPHREAGTARLVAEELRGFGLDEVRTGIAGHGVVGVHPATGEPVAVPGGRGMAGNHHPAFYANDDTLLTGVRLYVHAAYDHLVGSLLTP
ncbi:hypothetical protein [Streptomyces sp. NRRL S-448]|uniref:hypothetical protein n=1 Tax=Streptomyces sp. NRRL S-448 TaxID=1463907 RepID=UPI000A7ACA13